MKASRVVWIGVVLGALVARPAGPCAPSVEPLYWFTELPGVTAEQLYAGRLGLISGRWSGENLLVAYRHLEGLPMTQWARHLPTPASPLPVDSGGRSLEATGLWSQAVERAGGTGSPYIYRERERKTADGSYSTFYVNCLDDAFRTAATALDQRVARYGPGSREVSAWLAAQTQVFANCSDGENDPEELDEHWPAALRKDRAYQRAAAAFYADKLDVARARFAAIAEDGASDWAPAARFSLARTLIREGRLAEAESALRAIGDDAAAVAWHASAHRLLGFVAARLRPAEREAELGARLLADAEVSPDEQDVIDYLRLSTEPSTDARSRELREWMASMQAVSDADRARAVERYREKATLPRLVAALQAGTTDRATLDVLLRAAAAVPAASPAHLTVTYWRARRLAESGDEGEARRLLEGAVAGELSPSDRGALHRLQATLAPTLAEFVRLMVLPRIGEAIDGREDTLEGSPDAGHLEFPPEALFTLNHGVPLDDWTALAEGEALPMERRRDLAASGFVRAIVDGRDALAPGFAEALRRADTSLEPDVRPFLEAKDAEARAFLATLLLLRHSDLDYEMRGPTNWGQEWWCGGPDPRPVTLDYRPRFLGGEGPLTRRPPDEPASVFLGERVLAYADRHPRDPQVAEALHRVVRVTRYGCARGLDANGRISHTAFTRLHRDYPRSEWAKETPYWFN